MPSEDLSHAIQDYLKEIYKLQSEGERPTTTVIARRLGVAPSSATAMLKKLAALGLVEHAPYKGATLTPDGEKIALEVIRHHRLLEQYLAETLGLPIDEVHDEADRLEHVLSDELERRIDEALGFPTHDPHGDPIPDAELNVTHATLRSLAALEPGEEATIRRVPERRRGGAALPRDARARPRRPGDDGPLRAVRRAAHGDRRRRRARDLPGAGRADRRRLAR